MNRERLISETLAAIPQGSIGIYDLLPIYKDAALFEEIVAYLAHPYAGKIDAVASPEAIGWILGAAVARKLNVGFVPLRKGGKLPYSNENLLSYTYTDAKHSGRTYEMKNDSILANERVLLVDEWVEDGATLKSCIGLLNQAKCTIAGLATIGIDYNEGTKDWIDSGFIHYVGQNM